MVFFGIKFKTWDQRKCSLFAVERCSLKEKDTRTTENKWKDAACQRDMKKASRWTGRHGMGRSVVILATLHDGKCQGKRRRRCKLRCNQDGPETGLFRMTIRLEVTLVLGL